jgi:hypothetical protein
MTPPASPSDQPSPSPASLAGRLRRLDPAILPILAAGLVLLGAVAWLLGRPLPQPAADETAARLEALAGRVAALEGRAPPDLAPLRDAATTAAARAEAANRQAAALEQRLGALPALDPSAFAPRPALEALAGRVEALARDSAAASQQGAQRLAATEQALTGFAGRVAANEAALAARTQSIETQNARLVAMEQALAARLATLESQIAQRAQAAEQQAARLATLEGLTQRLAALEGRSARMAALDAVRVALEAGQPLGAALRPISDPPEPLARFAGTAPPTEAALRLGFEDAARAGRAASEPPAGTGVLDSAVSRLSGMITVRRGEEILWGDAAGAAIERARRALDAGDLDGALGHLARLSPPAREAMRGWIANAEALVAARAALRQLAAG